MSTKSKGITGERALVHLFWKLPAWVAVRVAGSGSMRYPSPDVIAGNGLRKLLIEAKVSANDAVYLTHKEVAELEHFADALNGESWIAFRCAGEDWRFVKVEDLKMTGKHYVVKKGAGLLFGDLVG